MPFYSRLKRFNDENRSRTIDRLLALRRSLRRAIPRRTIKDTLLLATWNLRDFDSNKFEHGPRLPESFFYIAEVISSFDLVALQEVNVDMRPFRKLMDTLGPNWDYIATDITEGRSGNSEWIDFVFDRRKILFRNGSGRRNWLRAALRGGLFCGSPPVGVGRVQGQVSVEQRLGKE